jgi:hypothetical protein
VPLAVVSPYARPHYVSHVVQDHTAITRFIEVVFGLPALTARDANSDALLDMFDFGGAPAGLPAPQAPPAGSGGCHGDIVLTTDRSSYVSADDAEIRVSFRGAPMPNARDRIGVYKYPTDPSNIPSEKNGLEPVAWTYIGGTGQTPAGAPPSGTVTINGSLLSAGAVWPLDAGLWIAHYLPALSSDGNGHTPAASVDFEVTP